MRRFAFFALGFTWLAACETPVSAPAPRALTPDAPSFAQLFNERIPFTATVTNPCPPPEPVAFGGRAHVHGKGEITPTSLDVKLHVNLQQVEGVGAVTGSRYRVMDNGKLELKASSAPPRLEAELEDRFRMIRQGSEDNLWARLKLRVTFVPPAPPDVEIIKLELECRGRTGQSLIEQ